MANDLVTASLPAIQWSSGTLGDARQQLAEDKRRKGGKAGSAPRKSAGEALIDSELEVPVEHELDSFA